MSTQPTPAVTVDPVNPESTNPVPETTPAPEPVVVSPVPSGDDIEKGPDGLYWLTVGNKVYKAKTIKALLQETAKAIANGDTAIRELRTELKIKRGTIQPDKADTLDAPQVKPLSTEEAFQLSQDLLRPDSMTKAVKRVVEATLGMPLESLRDERQARISSDIKTRAYAAGKEFALAHPEFIPSKSNEEKMFDYMEQENIAPISLKNYEIAYTMIKDTLDLREVVEVSAPAPSAPAPAAPSATAPAAPAAQPSSAAPAPAAPAAPARPRQATTGVTSRNSSVPANAPATRTGIPGFPTREQIERMSSTEYERWVRNPRFQEHYDIVYGVKK